MSEVPRAAWQHCVDAVICGNADQRVHTCTFNLGYTFHAVPELGQHRPKRRRRRLSRMFRRAFWM